MGPKEHCCIGPIQFYWYSTPFNTLLSSWNFDFSGTAYHTYSNSATGFGMPQTLNTCHSSHLMHISQSESTKCEIFGCLLNSPWQKKNKNVNFNREKVFKEPSNFSHISFWVCQSQCTMSELCVITFWVMMVFLDFWEEGLDIGFWKVV